MGQSRPALISSAPCLPVPQVSEEICQELTDS